MESSIERARAWARACTREGEGVVHVAVEGEGVVHVAVEGEGVVHVAVEGKGVVPVAREHEAWYTLPWGPRA